MVEGEVSYPIAEPDKESERINQKLYHVTGWNEIKDVKPGDAVTLKPGTQNAQGVGVYWSENMPRVSAAEGAKGDPSAILEILTTDTDGWYRSKKGMAKKYNKPRTWHSDGKKMRLVVVSKRMEKIDDKKLPIVHCAHRWIDEETEEEMPELVIT